MLQTDALRWRLVGPHRGGRSVAVAGDPNDPLTFYFGACAGGVFKTVDGGATWRPISDGFLKTGSVGAIAVAESDPNVIYVGMGEANLRDNVSHGDGVYRSTDGGATWQHVGLENTRHIPRVRIHPHDPDTVYAAAFGHAWGPNPDRGIYRSRDGGQTWEHILFLNEQTGAIDLVLDPTNPRILYAALYEAQRTPYSLSSGGESSRIMKSTDGGTTWQRIDTNPGMPTGIKGRIGVAVSPAQPNRVWASVEADPPGMFRSEDGGQTWQCVSSNRAQLLRPWYFMHIFADPVDPNTMFALNLSAWKSVDGGATYTELPIAHGDTHELWIDPKNPRRMIMGNDGGATVSYDGGETWTTQYNQPTAQFYQVITDDQFPYRIYGSQQDNTTVSIPTRSQRSVISRVDWHPVGGHESGHIAIDPRDPNIVYGGVYSSPITRYNHRTGQVQDVTVWPEDPTGHPAKDVKYRFNWTFPIVFSPHDPTVLYATGNHVFRTTNEGHSWDVISPDLTRNDISKLQSSGGPITQDNFVTEHYCTIFALAESPREPGLIWAGSDDGLIHVTRDGGGSWQNVTPPGLPEWALISFIEPSPYDPAVAYVAAARYKLDDFTPYLFKTTDSGQTWTQITNGISEGSFTRIVRADLTQPGLLYAGTETGVHVSFDDGESWQSLQFNLPVCPIYGLDVRHGDLIAGTHGRSFWTLDDLSPLQQHASRQASVHLFQPRPAYRLSQLSWYLSGKSPYHKTYMASGGDVIAIADVKPGPNGTTTLEPLDAGTNPPDGVTVDYYLDEAPGGPVRLIFRDATGEVIRQFSSTEPEVETDEEGADTSALLTARPGLNRFVWDTRYPEAVPMEEGRLFNYWARSPQGPTAPPGSYEVELVVDGESRGRSFEIRKDPRVAATDEELRAQFSFLLGVRDKISEIHTVINRGRRVRKQIAEWIERLGNDPSSKEIVLTLEQLDSRVQGILEALTQEKITVGSEFAVYPPQVNSKLAALAARVGASETPPTTQHYEVYNVLAARADQQMQEFEEIVTKDVPQVAAQIRAADAALISTT